MNLICECNVCGYIGDDRNSHDCSAHMQQRIAALTARAERSELAMRNAEAAAVRRWESSLSPSGRCESSNESDWQCLRQVGHCGEHVYAGDIERALDRADKAEAECLEQARLNGMGSEREAALLAKVAAEKAARERAEVEVVRAKEALQCFVDAEDSFRRCTGFDADMADDWLCEAYNKARAALER